MVVRGIRVGNFTQSDRTHPLWVLPLACAGNGWEGALGVQWSSVSMGSVQNFLRYQNPQMLEPLCNTVECLHRSHTHPAVGLNPSLAGVEHLAQCACFVPSGAVLLREP